MADEKIKKLYAERRQRVETTCNLKEPDIVPILSQVNVFGIGYGGYTIREIFADRDKERESYKKALTDFYCDTVVGFGVNYPYPLFIDEGSKQYVINPNGYTIMHQEASSMTLEEYPEFFADPVKYIANKTAYRKIAGLQKPYPESYESLERLFDGMDQHSANSKFNKKYVVEEMGLPLLSRGAAAHPLDTLFDFIRGFKNTLVDMRRNPELVHKAIETLTPFYSGTIPTKPVAEQFPYVRNTAHAPTFLSVKQFEEFYWPYVKWAAEKSYEMGTKYMIFCEGLWSDKFEFFESLPKGSFVGVLESDDAIDVKHRFGHFMTLAGGYTQGLLKGGTVQECIDCAKKYIDECAPGGGYMFTGDKSFLCVEDIKYENYKAITDFAHEYGRYH